MTNFDFLKDDPQFSGFADAAIAAERILPIDAATAVLDCRRAMEFAVKWMYSVDSSLVKPWDDKLISLMSTEEFHDIVDDDLWRRMDFIRKRGNDAAHGSRSISREQAELCLENLFLFLDFVAYCYGTSYQEKKFDASLLTQQPAAPVAQPSLPDVDLDALIKENAELKAQLPPPRNSATHLCAQAAGTFGIQDPETVYRLHAHRCRVGRGQKLGQRGPSARNAQQERHRLCRLCPVRR